MIRIPDVPWAHLATPLSKLDDSLGRLDERLKHSPVADGLRGRIDELALRQGERAGFGKIEAGAPCCCKIFTGMRGPRPPGGPPRMGSIGPPAPPPLTCWPAPGSRRSLCRGLRGAITAGSLRQN